jgi:hypothetical protein
MISAVVDNLLKIFKEKELEATKKKGNKEEKTLL